MGLLNESDFNRRKTFKTYDKAGCYRIDIGVESGSPGILKMMKKNINLDDVSRVDKLFGKYGIDWTAFFITGFPYETREDLAATAKFMKKINPYRIVLSNFTPYPGTEDYEKAKEMGTLPQKIDWSLLDHNSPDNFFMKNVGREEYQKFFQKLSDYLLIIHDQYLPAHVSTLLIGNLILNVVPTCSLLSTSIVPSYLVTIR